MKKVSAIALLFLLASVAEAGIGFVVRGGYYPHYVSLGQVVTIDLVATGPCNGFNIDAIGISGSDPIGTASLGAYNAGLTQMQSGYLENGNGVLIDFLACYATNNAIAAGQVLYSFSYTVPSSMTLEQYYNWSVTISPMAYGAKWWSVLDDTEYTVQNPPSGDIAAVTTPIEGLTLHMLVPEPMTLGLLGLGGLFLRRPMA